MSTWITDRAGNPLVVDPDLVLELSDTGSLRVRADTDDTVLANGGWASGGQTVVDTVTYENALGPVTASLINPAVNTAEAAASDFRSPAVITPQVIDAFVAQALAADPVRVDWREAAQWNALDPGAVRVPTLILHGERDPYAPAEHQARLYARLGHPTRGWIVIPGADHAAHLEDTMPWFVQAALGFLERARDPAQRAR